MYFYFVIIGIVYGRMNNHYSSSMACVRGDLEYSTVLSKEKLACIGVLTVISWRLICVFQQSG